MAGDSPLPSPQQQQKDQKKTPSPPSSQEWSILEETLLLKAICQGLRPVGTEKHFHMIGMLRMIHEGCQTSTKRVQDVWDKVGTLYNLQEFERLEAVPSPSAGEKRKRDAKIDDAKEDFQNDFEIPKFILNSTKNPPASSTSTPKASGANTGEKKLTRSSMAASTAPDKQESKQEPVVEEPNVKDEKDEATLEEPPSKQLRSSTSKPTTPLKNHDTSSTKEKPKTQEKTDTMGKTPSEKSSTNTRAASQKQSEITNPSPPIRRSTRSRRT
ncbi:histone acetyltransferase complex subunit Eaf7 [Schizosaccharomyces octosporus yFS286]|uniref:Histone acetyltransferase complex subunit Eaf7 n=1 Tax=Schizosaccharomyces octosporus (strain yFS286) TaxID=483514 RepID=S9R4G9_SCHOY|nr:histone acetyltransferase complex subunit Eaf7 [Schizosaccharomyces octosporus yFS286]EPX73245.1 histone acetyltransferase complex subunit Eaf7 [Schizosaccharomyces octosporus yFS286]